MNVDALAQRRPLAEQGARRFYVIGDNSMDHLRKVGRIMGVTNLQLVSERRHSYLAGEGSQIIAMSRGMDEPFFGLDLEAANRPIEFRDVAGDTHFGLMHSIHFFEDFEDHEGVMFVNASPLSDRRFSYGTLGFNSQDRRGSLQIGRVSSPRTPEPLMSAIRLAAHFRGLGLNERAEFIKAHS